MHQLYVIKTHPIPFCTVYPICQVKLCYLKAIDDKGKKFQLPFAAS